MPTSVPCGHISPFAGRCGHRPLQKSPMNQIICIAGPTASGKTGLAVELAKELDGEVISCDSMQIYRRMDIGTAKPTKEEMQDIPHHMLDIVEPEADFSVSRYCQLADPILQDILARGKTAIIAGGTGLYMDSLMRGNSFAPCPSTGCREALEGEADEKGMEYMLQKLHSIDPEAATKLHLSDRKRILRALEVYAETGETITAHNRRTQAIPPKYTPIYLGLDFAERSALYARIDLRVECMMQQGLLEEIQGLLASGIGAKCTAMQAIGYKEFVSALNGEISVQEAVAQVQQASRHYAKRQLTWFRRNSRMHWLIRREEDEILTTARQVLHEFDN